MYSMVIEWFGFDTEWFGFDTEWFGFCYTNVVLYRNVNGNRTIHIQKSKQYDSFSKHMCK